MSDLAGAPLSAEYEKRRLNLEKKISTVRKISPPSELRTGAAETLKQKRPRRIRSWSFPPITSHEPLPELSERKCLSSPIDADGQDGGKLGEALSSCSFKDEEESEGKEERLDETEMSLCNRKRFERLRQAYNSSIKIPHPRKRSASVPHVSTVKQDHRKPNPEYIQVISSLSTFVCEKRKECERKPNKKGFNVAWRCKEEDEG